jgi:dTDP-4-amino-4,6-dideoxygalactose transaminase
MQIPLFDLRAQTERLSAEIMEALRQVVHSGAYVQGPPIEDLQKNLASLCGSSHAIACSSGTDALLVSLMALNIGPGDEVVTTPFSFFATLGVVLRLGAVPVLVDIEPDSFNIDPTKIRAAITPRTKAIIPVHLYGQCAAMDSILEIAREHRIAVIEDCAQSLMASYTNGAKAGSMGDLGCISFYPSKNLGAMGDAGMVVARDEKLARRVAMLRNHGQSERYVHPEVGGNFRMDGFQAAVLNVKLKYLNEWVRRRQEIATQYTQWLEQLGLDKKAGLVPPKRMHQGSVPDGLDHVFHQYVIRVSDRNALKAHLEASGIGTAIYYPIPFHKQPCWVTRFGTSYSFPEAEKAANECLALPMFPELTDSQTKQVVTSIAQHYGVTA